jgi:3-dehydroquinate dehydratase/shikimate dehydrogenase
VRGLNTDYAAILDSLTDAMGCDRGDLRDAPVAILGAGGAARAAVAGLTDCGARVTIFNRTAGKARALAEEFDADARDWTERSHHDAKVVINTTSVGMHPKTDDTPMPRDALNAQTTIFDTVYNPIETRLLADARRAGCTTIDGVTMFVRQAAAQFTLFTGRDAPVDLMRNVVIKRLTVCSPPR